MVWCLVKHRDNFTLPCLTYKYNPTGLKVGWATDIVDGAYLSKQTSVHCSEGSMSSEFFSSSFPPCVNYEPSCTRNNSSGLMRLKVEYISVRKLPEGLSCCHRNCNVQVHVDSVWVENTRIWHLTLVTSRPDHTALAAQVPYGGMQRCRKKQEPDSCRMWIYEIIV